MANPTTNFGWQMPTSSDLVTDLPADFEVFGQAVDTSLADLKGGTTGQVLKKNTNADMDFVWGADSAGMTNPMTTTGDTIYSSSGSTPARLAIGSTNQVLTVAGGLPTWATPASGSLTLLSTTSLAGVSTVTISSISQSYTMLRVLIEDFDFNANDKSPAIRFNGDTSSNYTTGAGLNNVNSFSTFINLGSASNSNEGSFYSLEIPFYNNANIFKAVNACGLIVSSTGAGYYETSFIGYFWKKAPEAITSITIYNRTDGDNFDAGSVKIYGVN